MNHLPSFRVINVVRRFWHKETPDLLQYSANGRIIWQEVWPMKCAGWVEISDLKNENNKEKHAEWNKNTYICKLASVDETTRIDVGDPGQGAVSKTKYYSYTNI